MSKGDKYIYAVEDNHFADHPNSFMKFGLTESIVSRCQAYRTSYEDLRINRCYLVKDDTDLKELETETFNFLLSIGCYRGLR